jgi:hypothetical protein
MCWIAGRRHACLGGSIQNHKNKASLYGKKSLESGRLGQIVYKYGASPTVRPIDFIIQCTIPKIFIPQVDNIISRAGTVCMNKSGLILRESRANFILKLRCYPSNLSFTITASVICYYIVIQECTYEAIVIYVVSYANSYRGGQRF